MNYGILSLVPPLVMLLFALKTKKSFEALILGTLVGYILMHGVGFLVPWCDMLLDECSNRDNLYILMLCGMFGGLIFLLREVRGTLGFSNFISRYCKSERSVMLMSVLMGIVIFVDDYLNVMTVGTCMKGLFDKKRLPREALAYIIDSTGAPVCAILPLSTWVVFYSGMFGQDPSLMDVGFTSGLDVYYHAVPYMFYPFAALLVVFLFAMGWLPKLGPMKKAYQRMAESKEKARQIIVEAQTSQPDAQSATGKEEGNIFDFLIPMAILIGITVYTSDMFIAIVCTLASCLLLYLPRRKMTFTRFVELFWEGYKDMLPVLGILLACFMTKRVSSDMMMPEYVISLVQPLMDAHLIAAITFIVIAALTFVTSSFWGIEIIAISIVVPLAIAVGGNILLVLGAVVSGGVFGSHACFYADATVLSSSTCDVDNISHAVTQLPYALLGATIATLGFVIMGYAL